MINATNEFIIGLFLLVASAVIVGEIFTHIGQAALVGQLLVGIVLGPTLLGAPLGLTAVETQFSGLETLATFFILLMAGLSVSPKQLRQTGVPATLLGIGIFFVPFLAGAGLVHLLYPGYSPIVDLFIALTIAVTALPVLGIMLRDLEIMETTFGAVLLNAAVINELCAVSVFAILLRVYSSGGAASWAAVGTAVGTVLLFLATVVAIYLLLRFAGGRAGWRGFVRRFRATWNSREAGFALLIVAGLGAALYSQFLGLTFIVGAFYAGMLVTPEITGEKVHRAISVVFDAVTWGFFIPLFFVLVGFGTNFGPIGTSAVALAAFGALTVFALFSKFLIGAGIGLSLGWPSDAAFGAGFLMTSRGTVQIAFAVILVGEGIFSQTLFTIVAGVGVITTIVAPIAAGGFIRSMKATEHRARRELETPPPALSPLHLPTPGEGSRPPLPSTRP
jgi:Kef-type K+ transport system membrane component KefB